MYRQKGVALITVLMVFAIASIVVTKIVVSKSIDTQRIAGLVDRTQAHYYAAVAEQLAILTLMEDEKGDVDNTNPTDNLAEPWASDFIPYEVDNISNILIKIVDLNRFYNLNNLIQTNGKVNVHQLEMFKQLLVELNLDEGLAENLGDWLDIDHKEVGYLSETESYSERESGYRAGNQLMHDVSELRLVSGFGPDELALLLPHVTAIPVFGVLPLNVNTATEYALSTLPKGTGGGIGLSAAQNIRDDREFDKANPFASSASSTGILGSVNLNSGELITDAYPASAIRVYAESSTFYEINIRANYAGYVAYLTTIVKQEGSGDSAKFVVLSRRETDNSQRFYP